MIWNFAFTTSIWLSITSISLLLGLAIYYLRRRSGPAEFPFTYCCFIAIIWTFGSRMEGAAINISTKIFWHKFQGSMLLSGLTALTCFILEYAWSGRWLTHRNLALLSDFPRLFLGLVFLGDLAELMWRKYIVNKSLSPFCVAPFSVKSCSRAFSRNLFLDNVEGSGVRNQKSKSISGHGS